MSLTLAPDMSAPFPVLVGYGGLPPEAAELLADLRAEADDANVLTNASAARLREAQTEANELGYRARGLRERTQPGSGLDDVLRAERQVVAARARTVPLAERHAEHASRWGALAGLVQSLDRFVGERDGQTLEPWSGRAPVFQRGEKPVDALERFRREVGILRQEASRTRAAKRTKAEAIAAAQAFVSDLGARARPDVSGLFRGDPPTFPNLPGVLQQGAYYGDTGVVLGFAPGAVNDGLAVACWLTPDAVNQAFTNLIEAEADDSKAITAAAAEKRLAEIAVEILAAERHEEFVVRQLHALGMPVDRRSDAAPEAILQVEALA